MYYADDEVSISEKAVRIKNRTFSADSVESFDVRFTPWAGFRRTGMSLLVVIGAPFLQLIFLLLSIFIPALRDVIGGIERDGYARHWFDIVPYVVAAAAALLLIRVKERPPFLFRLTINGAAGRLASLTTADPVHLSKVASALKRAAPHARQLFPYVREGEAESGQEGEAIYADDAVEVTGEYIRLMGKTYPVSVLDRVEEKVLKPERSPYSTALWFWLFYVVYRVVMRPRDEDLPVITDTGLLLPSSWLFLLPVTVVLLVELVWWREDRKKTEPPLCAVTLTGKFGRYSKETVMSIDAFYTFDEQYAQGIVNAVGWALYRRDNREVGEVRAGVAQFAPG